MSKISNGDKVQRAEGPDLLNDDRQHFIKIFSNQSHDEASNQFLVE